MNGGIGSRAAAAVVGAWLFAFEVAPARGAGSVATSPASGAADPSTQIVPPRLLSSEVPYPKGASGDAGVVLIVTVNADGSVRAAHASEGQDPFTGAAEAAARFFRFEPATRKSSPIAAVIRLEIYFRDPARSSERTKAGTPSGPAGPPRAGGGAPADGAGGGGSEVPAVEVTIAGEKAPPMTSSLAQAEVRQLPGAFGDPFRAIEAMPGVTPMVSGLPFFFVRGAPPGNVGYFLDGIRVPYLYHVGLGPSVIHPAMVDHVDLYPGGYPARLGRFTGGIVSGESTPPRTDLHGEGNLRLFDVGLLLETGFAGGRGTALIGGRYSYTGALVSLLFPQVTLDYRDYQARVTFDLSPQDRITAISFGSFDLLGENNGSSLNVAFGASFYRLGVRYDHAFGSGGSLTTAVTLGLDHTLVQSNVEGSDRMLGIRTEARLPLGKAAILRGGTDVTVDAYEAAFSGNDGIAGNPQDRAAQTLVLDKLFAPRTDVAWGAFADLVFRPARGIEIVPGIRADLFTSGGVSAAAIDPRLAARFDVTDHVRLVHAYGLVHQPPSFLAPLPGIQPARLAGGLQESLQMSAGVEADLPEAMKATLTVFDNVFLNMTDTLGTANRNDERPASEVLDTRSVGSALGVELFLHRSLTKRLGGFLSYTLSRSTRSLGREHFPSAFDRTHVANAALAYDLGRNYRAGTRLAFYTGAPAQTQNAQAIRIVSPDRDPPFYRLDLRLEKRWPIGGTGWVSLVFELMNATLQKETFNGQTIGPITIPSVGVEAGF